MHARYRVAAWAMLGILDPLAVFGQTTIPADSRPQVADETNYIAKTGKTVPKPDRLDPNEATTIQRRTPQQMRDDAITRGICIGCSR